MTRRDLPATIGLRVTVPGEAAVPQPLLADTPGDPARTDDEVEAPGFDGVDGADGFDGVDSTFGAVVEEALLAAELQPATSRVKAINTPAHFLVESAARFPSLIRCHLGSLPLCDPEATTGHCPPDGQ